MIDRYYKAFHGLTKHNKALLYNAHTKSILASFRIPQGTAESESNHRFNSSLSALHEQLEFLCKESLSGSDRKRRKRKVRSLLNLCNGVLSLSKGNENISDQLDNIALRGLRRCITASEHVGAFDIGTLARLLFCELTKKSFINRPEMSNTAATCAKWVMITPSSKITASQKALAQAYHAELTGQTIGSSDYRAPGGRWATCRDHLFFISPVESLGNIKFTCTLCRNRSRVKRQKVPSVYEMTLDEMQTMWLEGPWFTCPRGHLYTRTGCDEGSGGMCIDCGVHVQ